MPHTLETFAGGYGRGLAVNAIVWLLVGAGGADQNQPFHNLTERMIPTKKANLLVLTSPPSHTHTQKGWINKQMNKPLNNFQINLKKNTILVYSVL